MDIPIWILEFIKDSGFKPLNEFSWKRETDGFIEYLDIGEVKKKPTICYSAVVGKRMVNQAACFVEDTHIVDVRAIADMTLRTKALKIKKDSVYMSFK